MSQQDRFYLKPPKPVSQMTDAERRDFAGELARATKQLVTHVKKTDPAVGTATLDQTIRAAANHHTGPRHR